MKKIFLFCFLLSFSLSSFSLTVEEIRRNVGGAILYSYGSSWSLSEEVFYGDVNSVVQAFKLHDLAVECSGTWLISPDIDEFPSLGTNSYSSVNIERPVFNRVGTKYYRLTTFSELPPIYKFAQSLYGAGYRGSGFTQYQDVSPTIARFNFNYSLAVADIASSTNLVYHRILLQHLSTISSSLNQIVVDVSGISSALSANSSVWTYDQLSNFVSTVRNPIVNGVQLDTDSIEWDIDPANHDLTTERGRSRYQNTVDMYRRGLPLVQSLLGASHALDSSSQGLSALGDSLNRSINDALTGGSSGGGGIAGDVKRLSTNDWASVVTNELAQGTRETKQQLKDNHDSITNRLAHMFDDAPNSVGRAIRSTAGDVSSIASKLDSGTVRVVVDGIDVGVDINGPVNFESSQLQSITLPISDLKDKINTWYDKWYSIWDVSDPSQSWGNFYDMIRGFKDQNHSDLSAITNSLLGVFSVTGDVSRIYDYLSGSQSNLLETIANSITNNWDDYYFKRFRRANEFNDEDDLPFTLEGASEAVFGRGFDEGEYSRLNWFSRVELLLFQLNAVSSGTNAALETVDIEYELNDTVDSFNHNGQDFVNASRRVVGVFQLIDGFAASMRAAFESYSDPVTRGIVLLPAGSWITDNALVLEVPVTIQNALRLVFQCIWYLSAFVVAWRVVVATWSRVVSFVRWLWSVFDI